MLELAWPAHDRLCRPVIAREVANISALLSHIKDRRTVVQAGGNVGAVPIMLAEHFARVLTFEPEPRNWACLVENVKAPNVEARQCGLSDVEGFAAIEFANGNAGAHQLALGAGDAQTTTIDALGLADCDFIQLDIEGMEALAIFGATETIARCSPVICLELKGLGARYGWPDQRLREHMQSLGYRPIQSLGRDVLWSR